MTASEQLRRIAQELSELADTDLGEGIVPAPLSSVRLLQAAETMTALYVALRRASRPDDVDDVLFTSELCVAMCVVTTQCMSAASKAAIGLGVNDLLPWEPERQRRHTSKPVSPVRRGRPRK